MCDADWPDKIMRIAYRPFDDRFTFYSDFLQRSRSSIFGHLLKNNLALIASRLVKGERPAHFFVTRLPTEKIFLSPKTSNNAFVFPLYRYAQQNQLDGLEEAGGRIPAISHEKAECIASMLGLTWQIDNGHTATDESSLTAEKLFRYAYAVFQSPSFRTRYAEFLKTDFPRILIPNDLELFSDLSRFGGELITLHLMESPIIDDYITRYIGPTNPEVGRVGWADNTIWLNAGRTNARDGHRATQNGTIGLQGVDEDIWDFHIGGYQVCHKWLKERKGRTLSDEDIAHYQKIIVALSETIRIMAEIDEVIEQHGGWPDAFKTG